MSEHGQGQGARSRIAQTGILIVSALMLSGSIGYLIGADGPSGFGTVIEPGSMVSDYDYVVFQDSGFAYVKDKTGSLIEGTPNDQLQYALNKCHSDGGGRIAIMGSAWTISSPLEIGNDTALEAANSQVQFIAASKTMDILTNRDIVNGNDNITVKGITFDGTGHSALGYRCIFFKHVTDAKVTDCYLTGSGEGLECEYSKNVVVQGCTATWNYGVGIESDTGSSNMTYINNMLQHNRAGGIQIDETNYAVVSNNQCLWNGGTGIGILISTNITVTANTVIHNDGNWQGTTPWPGAGLYMTQSSNIIIANNVFNENKLGVYVTGSYDCTIEGNDISDNTNRGVEVNKATTTHSRELRLISNQIVGNGDAGVYLWHVNETQICDNTIAKNTGNGLYLVQHCYRNLISDNYVWDNDIADTGTFDGIKVATYSCNNLIQGNIAYVTSPGVAQRFGVRINSADCSDNAVLSNYVPNAGKGASSVPISNAGTDTIIHYNIGYTTENSGAATITGAVNYVIINHGLVSAASCVVITSNNTGVGTSMVTIISVTQFQINFENQPGASTWTFYWYAEV